ncbi:hypothetical protein ACTWPT_54970 [Nonomuraea sp. 3N208]|uniref:hypothetical protein n=1 Tax=unclassified Nonomuraea TaxID=2593643 RepID=UPI00273A9FC0|nr:hypothetical protein [Nonomuraea sp. G32]MDP4502666.1 hypothetical protein [Nonomuraea sp. G32]
MQNLQDPIYKHRVMLSPGQLAATGDDVPRTNIMLKTRRVAMAVDGLVSSRHAPTSST